MIIEDEVMIGSRSMITQGARVGRGSVVGEGTILNPSILVIDAETGGGNWAGAMCRPWSVAVPGLSAAGRSPGVSCLLPCVLVISRLTEGERHDKARLNDILRATTACRRDRRAGDGRRRLPRGLFWDGHRPGGHPIGGAMSGGRWPTPSRPRLTPLPRGLSVEAGGRQRGGPYPTGTQPQRVLLAGHLDTVPPTGGNEEPRLEGETLFRFQVPPT